MLRRAFSRPCRSATSIRSLATTPFNKTQPQPQPPQPPQKPRAASTTPLRSFARMALVATLATIVTENAEGFARDLFDNDEDYDATFDYAAALAAAEALDVPALPEAAFEADDVPVWPYLAFARIAVGCSVQARRGRAMMGRTFGGPSELLRKARAARAARAARKSAAGK